MSRRIEDDDRAAQQPWPCSGGGAGAVVLAHRELEPLACGREDLRDAGLGDAEQPADLRAGDLVDVDRREHLQLTLGQALDRRAQRRGALAREQRVLRVRVQLRGLDRVADLGDRRLVPARPSARATCTAARSSSLKRSRSSSTPTPSVAASSASDGGRPSFAWKRSRACSVSRSLRRTERGAQSSRRSSSTIAPLTRVHANCSNVAPRVGIEAVDRGDEAHQAARHEVVDFAVRRDRARLPRGEVVHHRRVRQDELVARLRVALGVPGTPQGFGLGRGEPPPDSHSASSLGTSAAFGNR